MSFRARFPEKYLRPTAFIAAALFFALSVMYFLPVNIPHKICFPLTVLFLFSVPILPLPMCLAMLFSALGDYAGSCGAFLPQTEAFAAAHISMIVYFSGKYLKDRKLVRKNTVFIAAIFALSLMVFAFVKIVSSAPSGSVGAGVGIYSVAICAMLFFALVQGSFIFALGAILFVFSDFVLAWNKFVEPVEYAGYLIMVSYYVGQLLIFWGAVHRKEKDISNLENTAASI